MRLTLSLIACFGLAFSVCAAPPPPVTALAFHPEGRILAAGSYGQVNLIDPTKGEVVGTLPGQTQRVTALAFSKDGKRLAVASGEPGKSGKVRTYVVPAKGLPEKVAAEWTPHTDIIYTLAFSPDGSILASAGYDRVIHLHSFLDPEHLSKTFKDHSDTIYGIAFHPQGKLLASASADRAVKIWDVASGKRLHTLADSTDWVYAVAWSPDGKHVAAAGIDKSIRIWEVDAEANKLVQSVFAHTQPVTRLAYSSDGNSLFSASQGPNVKRWDTARMTEKLVFPPQSETILSMALSPDDKRLAIGRFDGACLLLDTTTGKTISQPLPEKPKPPLLNKLTPPAATRGTTVHVVFEGQHLGEVTEIVSGNETVSARIVAEARKPNRIEAEVKVAANAPVGAVPFTLVSPAGKSAPLNFIVDRFAVIAEKEPNASPRTGMSVSLPATLAGTIDRAGDMDYFRFTAQAGQQIGVQALTGTIGSKLDAIIELTDDTGKVLAQAHDGVLGFVCPSDGAYALGIHDREFRGAADMTYRLHVGDIPIVTRIFPLGVERGKTGRVEYRGVNLGKSEPLSVEVKVPADAQPNSRIAVPVALVNGEKPLGDASVVAGEFQEQNASNAAVVTMAVPGTVNGALDKPGNTQLVGFKARKGERLIVEVSARRIGSSTDSFIEILNESNKPVMRATLRCVARTFSVFRDHDSVGAGIRIETWNDLAMNDYIFVDGELMRIHELPKNPDDDCQFYQAAGQRLGFLDTTPKHHSQGVPMYKVEIHPPGSTFPPNGMPVFNLPYRNDDGGPGYGKDSRIFFDPPADDNYRVRVSDAQGHGGDSFGYRLTVRRPRPDFSADFTPTAPAVPRGGTASINVTITRIDGFDGQVQLKLENLPAGFEAPPTFIEAGQTTTTLGIFAASNATVQPKMPPLKLVAVSTIDGKEVGREAMGGVPKVIEPGDIVTTTAASEVAIHPGREARLLVKVERRNGFKGRIPLEVRGLPYGVRVLNIGLNGILITERDSEREVQIYAEPWVQPMQHPFVVLARREGKNSEHAAKPVLLKVEK